MKPRTSPVKPAASSATTAVSRSCPSSRRSTTATPRPYVDKGVKVSQKVLNDTVVPAAGAVVGSALSVWDAANDTRAQARLRTRHRAVQDVHEGARPVPVKPGIGAGGVIAIILGVAAALGILYAAWQTLRADDELWVADDPLRAPDA